ncbi:MAG: putative DNA binding domain-containing protein [Gammaproteobacteria bacterium]|nr:putative DNA binding domain-containing protein [Gammaproteobacteria bacterium]
MDLAALKVLIAGGESLTLEFKSERRERLNDRDLVEAVVCLTNAQGGWLLVGVENDGRISGSRLRHDGNTDAARLQALIRSRTVPGVEVGVELVTAPEGQVLCLNVPRANTVVSTSDGVCLRRVMAGHGPACEPYFPHQQAGRHAALGAEDFSAGLCQEAGWRALDPLQFERARQLIAALRGDTTLLDLDDREMAKALQVVETQGDDLVPTMAGLLLFGRQAELERYLPTHEAAFQVLTADADVRVNDFFRQPLLELSELILARFDARVQEREIQVGLIRVPVPDYSRGAFREALLNALFHRDYRRMAAVYVQWHPDRLELSSPGGFPEGVTPANILVHEPLPRNARLYAAAKRIGLVEQTGRGVDKVYLGQLRYGRPAPDYSRSDATGVRLTLRGGQESLNFAALVFERERQRGPLTVDQMIVLNRLFHERRITSDEVAADIQRSVAEARAVLERLMEEGLVEARGEGRGRAYHLAARLYSATGQPEAYVRVHGLEPLRQEALVEEYVRAHGSIRRAKVAELCGLSERQATLLLKKMVGKGKLLPKGERKSRTYVAPGTA